MKKVLIIAPHPDDEVLGCGGVIQYYKNKGDKVYVHIVANRVYNHAKNKEYLKDLEKSINSVASFLDIDDICYSGLCDEQLDRLLIDVIVPLEEYINKVQPDVVFLPNEYDTDQDHRAVSQACKVACRSIPLQYVYEVFGPSKGFVPNHYVCLNEEMVKKKIEALKLYSSEMREYPHPRSEKALYVLSEFRGIEINTPFAEGFRVIKQIVNSKGIFGE